MNTVEPIRDKRDVYAIKKYLRQKDIKYYIMFISLGLRINEILKMTVGDVKGRNTATFRQSKTGKEITVAYNDELLREYKTYCEHRTPEEALIPNPNNEYKPITRDMAYKVLREACRYQIQGRHTHITEDVWLPLLQTNTRYSYTANMV